MDLTQNYQICPYFFITFEIVMLNLFWKYSSGPKKLNLKWPNICSQTPIHTTPHIIIPTLLSHSITNSRLISVFSSNWKRQTKIIQSISFFSSTTNLQSSLYFFTKLDHTNKNNKQRSSLFSLIRSPQTHATYLTVRRPPRLWLKIFFRSRLD